MNINVELDLSDAELNDLAAILRCTPANLPQTLRSIGKASLIEYSTMVLGQKVFNRGSDIREYRLFLLIEEHFGGRLPDEDEITRLFQTTASESRALLRFVVSKYQYQLQDAVTSSMTDTLAEATQADEGAPHRVTINSQAVVEALNRTLMEADGSLQPVRRVPNSMATYDISPASFETLQHKLLGGHQEA